MLNCFVGCSIDERGDRTRGSPFNSQNTAVTRQVLEAYWMCPCVGRMDDIWPSYVVRRVADHLGKGAGGRG